ncbi:MAG TPA: DUF1697 domain-containing protein [Polyangiaceae bacterium]|nr:DUF1697 domain-containing protein [Polyangiaceae bacterium]
MAATTSARAKKATKRRPPAAPAADKRRPPAAKNARQEGAAPAKAKGAARAARPAKAGAPAVKAGAKGAAGGKTARYAAFLRGVSPINLKMSDLKRCLERAGYANVVTVLSSGNVVFDAPEGAPEPALERAVEAALEAGLPRGFGAYVRSTAALGRLLESDPFARHRLPDGAKRVVTFLREGPKAPPALPVTLEDAQIVAIEGADVLSAYVPGGKSPLFMVLIEKTFGKDVTTRTWDTVTKVAAR